MHEWQEERQVLVLEIEESLSLPETDAFIVTTQLLNEQGYIAEDLFIADDKGDQKQLQQHVKFDNRKTTRVCWFARGKNNTISLVCYGSKYVKPQCNLKLHQLNRTVENYGVLSADGKAHVLDTS